MNNSFKIVVLSLLVVFISGCVSMPDDEGWRSDQKDEFLDILEDDKYASLCDEKELYQKVVDSENSVLMSRLLVKYAANLANSCIDLDKFNKIQERRKNRKVETHFESYLQDVNRSNVLMMLRAGSTMEEIFAPYIPPYKQFNLLLDKYNDIKDDDDISKKVLDKLRINIERMKLQKSDIGDNYALINVPEYMVRVFEDKQVTLEMPVVVGMRNLQTPIFSSEIKYITLNPQWGIPDSIAKNEYIPKLLKDPNYLKHRNMVMRTSYDLKSKKVDTNSTEWLTYMQELNSTEVKEPRYNSKGKLIVEEMPFKIIEVPSKRNGLGRVKFIFPNKHAVYMHDTQMKKLFKRKYRAYSHGCIRLSKPIDMLSHISNNYSEKTEEEVNDGYKSLKTYHIALKKTLMMHTVYMTNYIDKSGKLISLSDIYLFDKFQKLNFK